MKCAPLWIRATILLALAIGLSLWTSGRTQAFQTGQKLSGHFNVIWGDPVPGSGKDPIRIYTLTDDHGVTYELRIDDVLLQEAGGILALNRRRVEVVVEGSEGLSTTSRVVTDIRVLDRESSADVIVEDVVVEVVGQRIWITILCKYSDVPDEPEGVGHFDDFYFNAGSPGYQGLDHYWRELSYNLINLDGSFATGWFDLPNPQRYYVPGGNPNFGRLFDDCTAAADPYVDFSNGGTGGYDGITMYFNHNIGGANWGGSRWAALDGVNKDWPCTWLPHTAIHSACTTEHEMGHAFGLPHSNNSDEDGSPYDSPWDIMSHGCSYGLTDPDYGGYGKHTIGFHKNRLGWIPTHLGSFGVYDADTDGFHSVLLHALEIDPVIFSFSMVRIPIGGSSTHYYTVEARTRVGPYGSELPGDAVIIHEVDESRAEPAWVVDGDDPPATWSDTEGVMWKVGETFEDDPNGITVTVDAEPNAGAFAVVVGVNAAQCAPAMTLGCGDSHAWSNNGSGSTSIVTDYGCTAYDYSGPEYAYVFQPPGDGPVTIDLTGLSADLDLLVIRKYAFGAACNPEDCIAASTNGGTASESITFDAIGGVTYYLVVDGYAGSVSSYNISVSCQCDPGMTLGCGYAHAWSNDGSGSTSIVTDYGCADSILYSGPEYAYTFQSPSSDPVILNLTGLSDDLDLLVLEQQVPGAICNPEDCIAASTYGGAASESVIFDAVAGRIYYVVVEGYLGAVSPYNIFLSCCGDASVDYGEGCDDGNTTPGDGCDATCQVESCFGCVGEPSVCTCDVGAVCGSMCGGDLECQEPAPGACSCVVP